MKKDIYANSNKKKEVVIISEKIKFKSNTVSRDKGHYIMIKSQFNRKI